MKYFLLSSFFTFTIWMLTALTNAVMSALLLFAIPLEDYNEKFVENFALLFFCTLLFSLPGIFIFWLLFIFNNKATTQSFFRLLFRAAFFIAVISALLFCVAFYREFHNMVFLFALSIIFSTIAALIIHHHFIIKIVNNKIKKLCIKL